MVACGCVLGEVVTIEEIADVLEETFGGVDCYRDGDCADICFRAQKKLHGAYPAIAVLHFRFMDGEWLLLDKNLAIPLWDCLRNKCGVKLL